jgi:aryl-alcohol dehydrogenase-like predicted oxidoreductase
VKAGKALYIGASSMYAWQFQKMLHFQQVNHLTRFVTMQNHYNLVYREEEREMIPLCIDQHIGCLPWSPLARGFLTGSRKRGDGKTETLRARTDDFGHGLYYRDTDFDVVDRVIEIAEARQAKPAQVALAWILSKSGVTAPIIGASTIYWKSRMRRIQSSATAISCGIFSRWTSLPHPICGSSVPTK